MRGVSVHGYARVRGGVDAPERAAAVRVNAELEADIRTLVRAMMPLVVSRKICVFDAGSSGSYSSGSGTDSIGSKRFGGLSDAPRPRIWTRLMASMLHRSMKLRRAATLVSEIRARGEGDMDRRFRSRSPAVLMRRCCRLMSDHVSTCDGDTNRRHRFPRLEASTLSCKRRSLARNSTSATTRLKQVQVPAGHAKLLSNEAKQRKRVLGLSVIGMHAKGLVDNTN